MGFDSGLKGLREDCLYLRLVNQKAIIMSELQTFSQFTKDFKELCSYLSH
jgi:hypothetical protein